jgi:16S rRNA (cytosine1402-N4)-methyltransferase
LSEAPVEVNLIHANFADAPAVLEELGVGGVDLLLADLGFSSTQMDDPQRGFSFNVEAPLDMRLDDRLTVTAADLVNALPERELADMIYQFGEERLSRQIARKIVADRQRDPILTTSSLAQIVRSAYGQAARKRAGSRRGAGRQAGRSRIDPATRTFMALRIAVNQELAALERLLESLPRLLRPRGVAAVISFHSLEDRKVKQSFLKLQQEGLARRLTTKPVVADEDQIAGNPRSRSAKLRAIRMADNGYTGDAG